MYIIIINIKVIVVIIIIITILTDWLTKVRHLNKQNVQQDQKISNAM